MDEVEVKTKKIETEVNQETTDYINYAYNKEITCWKEAALERVLNESKEKEMIDLAPSRVLLIRNEKSKKTVNIDEIIFFFKSMYSTHNEEPRTFINDNPTEEPSFEALNNYLKTFSKYIKDDENMSLKNKCLFGGWRIDSRMFIWWIDGGDLEDWTRLGGDLEDRSR